MELHCVADDPSADVVDAIANGALSDRFGMTGGIFHSTRGSSDGRYVQVGDEKIVDDEPRSTRQLAGSGSFSYYSGAGFVPGTVYLAWAFWGGTSTCSPVIDGIARQATYLDGSHAFLIGPESFTTGVFVQQDNEHLSVGRTMTTDLKGGVLFAHMWQGEFAEGSLHYDDQVTRFTECRGPNGGTCGIEAASASTLTATLLAAYDFHHGGHGEVVVVTLPPGV